jgi:hypothetical protein
MQGGLMQEWITLKAGAGVSVAQMSSDYIDVTHIQDLAFWIDVTTASGTPSVLLSFETAPLKEEGLFIAMAPAIDLTLIGGTVTPVAALAQDALVPAARWARWKVTSASAWSATFRVFVAKNEVRP